MRKMIPICFRAIALLAVTAILLPLGLTGCAGDVAGTEGTVNTGAPEPSTTVCEHSFATTVETPAGILTDGTGIDTCSKCGYTQETVIPATKTVKILAFGNSFSEDALEYLWHICRSAGVKEVVIGNMFVGGCSLDMHWDYMSNETSAYTYYKNESGIRQTNAGTTAQEALLDEDWDIVTIQQQSSQGHEQQYYTHLSDILDYLQKHATNPDVKFYYHMTWAYQQDSTNPAFPVFNSDQMTMYRAIVDFTRDYVTDSRIVDVIPSGTAVQNVRTSSVGDTLTRDGYHLSFDLGRYIAGLTYACKLLDVSPYDIKYTPDGVTKQTREIAREAVVNAIAAPYEVTKSTK